MATVLNKIALKLVHLKCYFKDIFKGPLSDLRQFLTIEIESPLKMLFIPY